MTSQRLHPFLTAAFWLACIAVAVLSLLPVNELPKISMDIWDKAQHASGFALLGLLGLLAYPPHATRVLGGLLLFGAGIEFAQAATGWRTGDALDWLADALGLSVAMLGILFTRRRQRA